MYEAALYVLILTGPQAHGQTTLAWQLQPGASFRVHHRVVQAMTLEGKAAKPLAQKSATMLETHWRVREVKDQVAIVTVTVEVLSSKSNVGDGKDEAASKDDALWRGAVFEVEVHQHGRLRNLRGYEELLKKLANGDASRLKVLRALKPAGALEALFQDALGPLADRAVTPGDRWSHRSVEAMNLFGAFEHTSEFSYRGVQDKLHKVDSKRQTTFKNPRYAIENDVFRVLKGVVQTDDSTGHFLFDGARGRMVRVERQSTLRGELTLETLGTVQRVPFASEERLTVRVE